MLTYDELVVVNSQIARSFGNLGFTAEQATESFKSFFRALNCPYDKYYKVLMPNNWLKMHGYPKRRRARR